MTAQYILDGAPKGATHYYKNEYIVAYYFYSGVVNLWFVYSSHHDYWMSQRDCERIEKLKPLKEN